MRRTSLLIPVIVSFLLGFIIGLFLFGWYATPPNFTNAGPEHLADYQLDNYVSGLASRFAATGNANEVMTSICYPVDDFNAIQARATSGAAADSEYAFPTNDYNQILQVVEANGTCEGFRTTYPPKSEAGSGLLTLLCSLGLLGLALLGLIFWAMRSGGAVVEDDRRERRVSNDPIYQDDEPEYASQAQAPPPATKPAPVPQRRSSRSRAAAAAPQDATALGGFQSTYVRGDDGFDKSFIIENANGDFLGECGVSLSETLGSEGGAKNVTAFEIWLFDKNDTHTVTKVIMSENAHADEGIRAKLATRGEPVRADYDEVIALETNSLIINAEVTEIDYSDRGSLNSIFDRFTIDLSAWVKRGPNDETLHF